MFPTLQVDIDVLYAINIGCRNAWFDVVLPFITNNKVFTVCIYGAILATILSKGIAKFRSHRDVLYLVVFAMLLLIPLVVDPLSSALLKETIGRQRPYLAHPWVNKLVGSGGGSFPSNHALNNAAAATMCTYFFRKHGWLLWVLTACIMFARVYEGVHYPTDVVGGAAIGVLVGLLGIDMSKRVRAILNARLAR